MKLKLNILDWVIIGVLALLLLFGAYQIWFSESSIFAPPNEVELEFEMEFRRRTEEFYNAIEVGDIITISRRERDTAEIIAVRRAPARIEELDRRVGDSQGFILAEIPYHYDVFVTARTTVIETDRAFMNGRTAMRLGGEVLMQGRAAAEGFIVDMRREGERWMSEGLNVPDYDYGNGYGEAYNGDYNGYETNEYNENGGDEE